MSHQYMLVIIRTVWLLDFTILPCPTLHKANKKKKSKIGIGLSSDKKKFERIPIQPGP